MANPEPRPHRVAKNVRRMLLATCIGKLGGIDMRWLSWYCTKIATPSTGTGACSTATFVRPLLLAMQGPEFQAEPPHFFESTVSILKTGRLMCYAHGFTNYMSTNFPSCNCRCINGPYLMRAKSEYFNT